MKKRILITALAMLLCACSDNESKNNEEKTTVEGESNYTEDGQTFDIPGYDITDNEMDLNSAGDVKYVTSIEMGEMIGSNYLRELSVLEYNDKYIVVQYSTSNVEPSIEDEDMDDQIYEQHTILIDAKTHTLIKDIKTEPTTSYIRRKKDIICCNTYEEDKIYLKTYDLELNEIADFEMENHLGDFSADGKRYYYAKDLDIYVYDSESGKHTELESDGKYLVDMVDSVITDDAGKDYIIFTGMAADYNRYQFIIEADSGRVVYVLDNAERFLHTEKNIYLETSIEYSFVNRWILGVSENKAYDYKWQGDDLYVDYFTLENKNLLFTYVKDNEVVFELYDYNTGDMIDAASMDISLLPASEIPDDFDNEYMDTNPFVTDAHSYMDGRLIIQMANSMGDKFFVKWYLDDALTVESQMVVSEYHIGSQPSVDISEFTNQLYKPEELNEEYKPLRSEADKLEEEYGIEIYIGEECGNTMPDYSIKPLTDYTITDSAIDILAEELSRYPKDFFRQFQCEQLMGLEIHIASEIKGVMEGTLGYAGGITTTDGGWVIVVLDCQNLDVLPSVINHELCHAIDYKCDTDEEIFIKLEEEWGALNPPGYIYMNSYSDWGDGNFNYQEYEKYIYEIMWHSDGDLSNTYFVDTYGAINEDEDRARLFESVMSDANYDIDFDAAPHLKEKLNFYVECIRAVFDTTGWKDVPWEVYMD